MLSLALFTRNQVAAEALEQIVQETGLLRLALTLDPATPIQESQRSLSLSKPELILADLTDWELLQPLKANMGSGPQAPWIGFAPDWDASDELAFSEADITRVLRQPFGPRDLETAAFDLFHERGAEGRPGLWAFLPSKAGAGCSTLVLNTAKALQQETRRDLLVVEADAHSGCYSLLMNFNPARSINDALEYAAGMTALEWRHFHVNASGMHILPADPAKPGRPASWCDYYHLLRFLENRYKHIFVDLPDVVDDASAEVVRRAEHVFVVCTAEILSLKLAEIRCQNLMDRGVPQDRIQLVVTRHKRDELSLEEIEKNLGWPVYSAIANDGRAVRSAVLEGRLVSGDSAFAKDCRTLARKLSGITEVQTSPSALQRLSRLIAK